MASREKKAAIHDKAKVEAVTGATVEIELGKKEPMAKMVFGAVLSTCPATATAKRVETMPSNSWSLVRAYFIAFAAIAILGQPGCVCAQDIAVRVREGFAHGFLVLRNTEGAILASGEVTQLPHGNRITARLVFRFKDGSIDDETTIFSQGHTFHLISDRHIQKGPSFPHPYDASIDTVSQHVTVRDEKNAEPKTEFMELPPSLSNGLVLTLIRNLRPDASETEIPYLAISSKPRLVKLAIAPEGEDHFRISGFSHQATRYVIRIKLGGVAGIVAPAIGKQPADSHVWVTHGTVPTVVRVDAPTFTGGPVWSIQLASPIW
jgi:hypothetical protein